MGAGTDGDDAAEAGSEQDRGPGRLVVLAGPSGVGKSTVVAVLRSRLPQLHFSVSATTRGPRPGEVDGRDYTFVTPAQFQRMVDDGEMLEWAEIHRGLHRSGTPAAPVRAALAAGTPVLVEVDLAGAREIRRTEPGALLVFLSPPSWEALVSRLTGRGTEDEATRARRFETARLEMAAAAEFDTTVVNDDVEDAATQLLDLLVGAPRDADSSSPGPATTVAPRAGDAPRT